MAQVNGKNTYLDIVMLECALRLPSPVYNRSCPCLSSLESNCLDRALLPHRVSPANRTSVPRELISLLDSFLLSPPPISIRYSRANLWNRPRVFRQTQREDGLMDKTNAETEHDCMGVVVR